ncbi:MAG TPA: TetR/AcrR family transcriptional regulator [Spirochaetia bacterium]|nr:TetR/AcrR family transcriptional regulator [Spirochaetia bacterium]
MARLRDQQKRRTILETSKMLFSQKGFFNTSVSDIVHETGFPVGTIYTYFRNKEEIIQVIVSEGWYEFRESLVQTLAMQSSPEGRLRTVIDLFLPRLLNDLDFINILLSEAIQYTRIEEKIEDLTSIVAGIIPSAENGNSADTPPIELTRRQLETALMVYFLGIMDAARISRSASVGITVPDLLDFVRISVHRSLGVPLGENAIHP